LKNTMTKKLTMLAAAASLFTAFSTSVSAQGYYPAPYGYGAAPYQGMPMPYGSPYNYGPRNFGPRNFGPNNYGPNNYGPRNFGPRGFGPWGGGDRRGFGNGMPFESNFTPWSRRFWDEIGEGGDNPFRNMDEWIKPNDPKEGAAQMWDDMLNAPNEAGQMPGGWTAPSISVPNPIDVGDEFKDTATDMPDEMRNQMDNVHIQTW